MVGPYGGFGGIFPLMNPTFYDYIIIQLHYHMVSLQNLIRSFCSLDHTHFIFQIYCPYYVLYVYLYKHTFTHIYIMYLHLGDILRVHGYLTCMHHPFIRGPICITREKYECLPFLWADLYGHIWTYQYMYICMYIHNYDINVHRDVYINIIISSIRITRKYKKSLICLSLIYHVSSYVYINIYIQI